MKIKEFVAIEKRLLPSLPGFAIKGALLFIAPIEHTLRGFCFEGSSFDKTSFYVWHFFLPMCVPTQYLSFSFGDRLRNINSEGWSAEDPNLDVKLAVAMQKKTQILATLNTPQDVVQVLGPMAKNSKNPYCYEALAYMLARAGEIAPALPALDYLLTLLDSTVSWQHEMALRAQALKDKLMATPTEAAGQLAAWESESIRNLGLEEFRGGHLNRLPR